MAVPKVAVTGPVLGGARSEPLWRTKHPNMRHSNHDILPFSLWEGNGDQQMEPLSMVVGQGMGRCERLFLEDKLCM
jgi:hypothetical protein